jgi:hypothetical protein
MPTYRFKPNSSELERVEGGHPEAYPLTITTQEQADRLNDALIKAGQQANWKIGDHLVSLDYVKK